MSLTSLQSNPFRVLAMTTRDNSRRIVEAAEERALFMDETVCQKARSELTNPRTRLSAEVSWLPGVAPTAVESLLHLLEETPTKIRDERGLSPLVRANVLSAALELATGDETVQYIADAIGDLCWTVEQIDPERVMQSINEDRIISGFPEIPFSEINAEEISHRGRHFRNIVKTLLDRFESDKIIHILTEVTEVATDNGSEHGPSLLYDLIDSYEVETQEVLQRELDNIDLLLKHARTIPPTGNWTATLRQISDVLSNWKLITAPINISAKSRGLIHQQSQALAYKVRSLGIDLVNEHDLIEVGQRLTKILSENFADLPEMADRLERDSSDIAYIKTRAEQLDRDNAEWVRSISFQAEVGMFAKSELSISENGIKWKDTQYPLNSITRVRWGGVRKSVNGIPTGTDYTIAFGDNYSEQVISLRKEATFSGFIDALWRAVCVRLMIETLQALSQGRSFTYGDIVVNDTTFTLTRHKFLGTERVQVPRAEAKIWSSDGKVFIGHQNDKKVYGQASYINHANAHIIEHIVRGSFKKGNAKFSDYLNG